MVVFLREIMAELRPKEELASGKGEWSRENGAGLRRLVGLL